MELYDALCSELAREKYLVSYYDEFIKTAPKGYLVVRERETGSTFYWAYPNGKDGSYKQLNITDQDDLVAQLVKKMIGSKVIAMSKKNIKYMEKLKNNFCDISAKEILKKCPDKYQDAALVLWQQNVENRMLQPYSMAPYDPEVHVHETDCGIMVRSKGEQILCNTFTAYGIPFHYEEEFIYDGEGPRIYSDFRILLPAEVFWILEHLGLLSDLDYCIRNANKLNIYQKNKMIIGENLILTMDDYNENISSSIIIKIIERDILPALNGVRVSKELISAANVQRPRR